MPTALEGFAFQHREDSPTGAVRGLLLCDIASAEVQSPEVT